MNRLAMSIAAVCTAFVLVVAGGVAGYLSRQPTRMVATAPAPAAGQAVSQEQAVQAATTYLGGGTVRSVTRGTMRGSDSFTVSFTDGSAVVVDAASGQLAAATLPQQGGEQEHQEERHEDGEGYDD